MRSQILSLELGHPTVLCLASQNSIICITNLHIKTGMVSIFPIRPWLVQHAGPLLVGLGSPVWAPRLQLCCPCVNADLLLPQTRYRDRVTEAWGAPSLSPRQCWTRNSPLPLCPVPEPESPASVPCFPGELSLANLGQDFSPFNFWNRVIFSLSFEGSEILWQINLSSPQHPALCDKGHTVFYSSRSPGQWMPSALPYNRIIKGGHRRRALLSGLLVTEDETRVQLSPPPWSLSCFAQAVFNHTHLYVTTTPCSCICGSAHHRVWVCGRVSSPCGAWTLKTGIVSVSHVPTTVPAPEEVFGTCLINEGENTKMTETFN